jgi:SpoVK/Ycf46/Vps4 family AAA+-type ATPase
MVMVLGATNQPWELDDAFKRRFEKRIHIPLPGAPERVLLFRLCLRGIALAADVALEALAARTEHYSGSDCAVVAKHAAFAPMRHKQAALALAFPGSERMRERIAAIKAAEAEVKATPISMGDLLEAVAANRPSASVEGLARFVEYAREHGAT